MLERLKDWARDLKRDVIVLWLAARDPRVPWYAKAMAGLVAGYALSPIDLIPDFVPVLGYLDDLLIVPAGIWITMRLIPPPVVAELRIRASGQRKPNSAIGLAIVLALWLGAIGISIWAWWRR